MDQQRQDMEATLARIVPLVLGNRAAKLTIDENDNINFKTDYAKALEAQTKATEQSGLPTYGGIDPEMVLQLMGQRAQQDQQFRREPFDIAQGQYQAALANHCGIVFTETVPEGLNLADIIHKEVTKRGESYVHQRP